MPTPTARMPVGPPTTVERGRGHDPPEQREVPVEARAGNSDTYLPYQSNGNASSAASAAPNWRRVVQKYVSGNPTMHSRPTTRNGR